MIHFLTVVSSDVTDRSEVAWADVTIALSNQRYHGDHLDKATYRAFSLIKRCGDWYNNDGIPGTVKYLSFAYENTKQ